MLDSRLTLAIVGSGTMGEAIVRGLLRSGKLKPRQIIATDRRVEVATAMRVTHDVRTGTDNQDACREADVIVLAVKPHEIAAVVDNDVMRDLLTGKLVISIAAGVRLAQLASWLPASAVIRAMPNTPCLIGEGMTVIARGASVGDAQAAVAMEIAAQMFQGAARMVLQTGQHPAALKDQVTTPAGCTIAGLLTMEDGRIRSVIARAVEEAAIVAGRLGQS